MIETPRMFRQPSYTQVEGCQSPQRYPSPHTPITEHRLDNEMFFESSPNSLYLYEQEKSDMQSSYASPCSSQLCGVPVPVATMSVAPQTHSHEDYDLNPCFECSQKDILKMARTEAGTMPGIGTSPWINECGAFEASKGKWVGGTVGMVDMTNAFQVDETELGQGPTLAALNAEEDISQDFADIESIIKKDSEVHSDTRQVTSARHNEPTQNTCVVKRISTKPEMDSVSARQEKVGPLHELLTTGMLDGTRVIRASVEPKKEPVLRKRKASGNKLTQLQVKKPATATEVSENSDDSLDRKWEEVKHDIFDETSSTPAVVKVERQDMFDTKEYDHANRESDEDYIDTDDDSATSDDSHTSWPESSGRHLSLLQQHHDSYFWQYNIQAKGPKGKRLFVPAKHTDPHVLDEFQDPVFNPGANITVAGIRHGGKARRGDGNDVSPNPWKLYKLGDELKKLSDEINDMTPTSNVSPTVRNKTRKEKNKLASRACRLKKKANHEANKMKMFALNKEHKSLMTVLTTIQMEIKERISNAKSHRGESLVTILQKLVKAHLHGKVAGHTTEYVNEVIKKVAMGDQTGGLDI